MCGLFPQPGTPRSPSPTRLSEEGTALSTLALDHRSDWAIFLFLRVLQVRLPHAFHHTVLYTTDQTQAECSYYMTRRFRVFISTLS